MLLSAEQVESVNRCGYISLPHVTSRDEAAKIRVCLEGLFARRAGENEGAYGELIAHDAHDEEPNSPQILLPVNYAPELHKTECFANAERMAKQILGEDAAFILDLAIYKRAGDGASTPWHQDSAYRDARFEYREVTIWVALQDVDEKSSCMAFIPGSHVTPIFEHRATSNDGSSIALECVGPFNPALAVKAELPLGGCTIHFARTLHSSTPNRSEVPRIVYIMTFGLPPLRTDRTEPFPWLQNSETEMQKQRRRWMQRGGAFVTLYRRIRRGEFKNWRLVFYLGTRAVRTIARGR